MCMEGDRHVQQDLSLLDTSYEVLDAIFQLVGSLINFLWITFASLGQLLCSFQQFVSISVGVLKCFLSLEKAPSITKVMVDFLESRNKSLFHVLL